MILCVLILSSHFNNLSLSLFIHFKIKTMASRRKLKKTIQFISYELINEIFFRSLLSKNTNLTTAEELSSNVLETSLEFILRANHSNGNKNPKLVKTYYKKLFSEWEIAIDKIIVEIDKI